MHSTVWRFWDLDVNTRFVRATEVAYGSSCSIYLKIVPRDSQKTPNAARLFKNISELITFPENEKILLISE